MIQAIWLADEIKTHPRDSAHHWGSSEMQGPVCKQEAAVVATAVYRGLPPSTPCPASAAAGRGLPWPEPRSQRPGAMTPLINGSLFWATESAVQEKQIRVLVPVSEFVKVRLASQCQPVPFCLRVEVPGSPSVGSAWERADPEAHCTVLTQLLQSTGHAPQMRPTHTAWEPALDGAQSERLGELRTYEFTKTAHGWSSKGLSWEI